MRTLPSLLRRAMAAAVAATLATTLLPAPARASGTIDVNLTIAGVAACQRDTGQWHVRWHFRTESSRVHHIEQIRLQGARFSASAVGSFRRNQDEEYFRAVPGTAAAATIVAEIRREDETASVEYTRTIPLGEPCVPDTTPPTECASLDEARYRHTFDAANSRGMVEIVDKPLCEDVTDFLVLASEAAATGSPHDHLLLDFDSTVSRLVAQVGLPRCSHTVYFSFNGDLAEGTLGSATGPGSRSSGPYARSSGGTGACAAAATLAIEPRCNGDMAFRLANAATATWHATATAIGGRDPHRFHDALSATPGETYEVVSRHDDPARFPAEAPRYDEVLYEVIEGYTSTYHRWKRPMTCPLRHNDLTDDNRSDFAYLMDSRLLGQVSLVPVQSDNRSDGSAPLGSRTAFPWSGFRAFSGDFSGDHKMDVIAIRSEQAGRVTMHRMVSTGTGGSVTFSPVTQVWDSGVNGWYLDRMQPVVGDFDADRHEDLAVFYRYDNARTALWVFNGNADGIGAPRMVWDSGVGNWNAANTVPYAADVNGDGKTDVGAMYRYAETVTGAWNWLSNGTGFAAPFRAWQHDSWSLSRSKVVTGDFNADGKGDVATLYSYADWEWKLWTMTGRADGTFGPATVWYSHPKNWADPARISLAAGDYNGDGNGDVGLLYRYPTDVGLWHAISSGTTFAGPTVVGTRHVDSDPTVVLP